MQKREVKVIQYSCFAVRHMVLFWHRGAFNLAGVDNILRSETGSGIIRHAHQVDGGAGYSHFYVIVGAIFKLYPAADVFVRGPVAYAGHIGRQLHLGKVVHIVQALAGLLSEKFIRQVGGILVQHKLPGQTKQVNGKQRRRNKLFQCLQGTISGLNMGVICVFSKFNF